jgi:hypothetical protein
VALLETKDLPTKLLILLACKFFTHNANPYVELTLMMVSGGRGALNQLGHDWVYWETGKVTPTARQQVLQDRLAPASLMIILGAIALVLWRHFGQAFTSQWRSARAAHPRLHE